MCLHIFISGWDGNAVNCGGGTAICDEIDCVRLVFE